MDGNGDGVALAAIDVCEAGVQTSVMQIRGTIEPHVHEFHPANSASIYHERGKLASGIEKRNRIVRKQRETTLGVGDRDERPDLGAGCVNNDEARPHWTLQATQPRNALRAGGTSRSDRSGDTLRAR